MTIKEIIEQVSKGEEELYSIVATVDEVDESAPKPQNPLEKINV